MKTNQQCPRCGASIGGTEFGGLCPRCVVAIGLAPQKTDELETTTVAGVPPAKPRASLLVGEDFGSYHIMGVLGRGGMGEVYEAERALPPQQADAEASEALEMCIAKRVAPMVTNAAWLRQAWWLETDERKTLEDIVAKHRLNTNAELQAAMTLLLERGSPSIRNWLEHWRSEEADAAKGNRILTRRWVTKLATLLSCSAALGFLFVVIPSLFLSLVCRGGALLRGFELAIVKRNGSAASRLRIFWRTLLTWTFLAFAGMLNWATIWPLRDFLAEQLATTRAHSRSGHLHRCGSQTETRRGFEVGGVSVVPNKESTQSVEEFGLAAFTELVFQPVHGAFEQSSGPTPIEQLRGVE